MANIGGGKSYKKVLNAEQQVKAEHFMRCLLTNDRKAKQAGLTVNINEFLNNYACEYGKGGSLSEHFKLSDYRKRLILTLCNSGKSPRSIADDFGMNVDRIYKYLKKCGACR